MTWFIVIGILTLNLVVVGEHEADPEGDPEGDVRQLDPPPTSDHRHVHDDGTTAFRNQLRKYFI